jgi:tRNA A-37 threonylcarbamoyl transferase component Bud32
MTGMVGTLLDGRYRLDAEVGSGGMSTVYRAFDTILERPVAIKLMHADIASRPDQIERFRREARAVAQLSHPHIVTVIDAGEDDGTPYIVFEYVEGETLKERIRSAGRLPVPEAVAYAIEIGRALGAAHERAIVHRDVKPQNVLIDGEGSAKVTDFGIARTLTEEGLTADGRVLGTTDYVSPEQALGRPVTGQSDIYSLGIVLYEMLTGHVPFAGDNQVAVAMRHVREEIPDVQKRRPDVSAALAAVIDRATAKELDRRYLDVTSLVSDLEEVFAIEAARAGNAPGEATTILRTLPGRTQRRIPLRLRHSSGLIAALLLIAGVVVGLAVLAANRTHRGVGTPGAKGPEKTEAVLLRQGAAHDYDPAGDKHEHAEKTQFAIDGDTNTYWNTEDYHGGGLQKAGVGLYVDAPSLVAKALRLQTPTPGWSAEVYASQAGPPDALSGWTRLASIPSAQRSQTVPLSTGGRRYRYYLVWITKLPPAGTKVQISEVTLFR